METDVDVLGNRPSRFKLHIQKLITVVLSHAYGLELTDKLMTRNRRILSYPVLSCEH